MIPTRILHQQIVLQCPSSKHRTQLQDSWSVIYYLQIIIFPLQVATNTVTSLAGYSSLQIGNAYYVKADTAIPITTTGTDSRTVTPLALTQSRIVTNYQEYYVVKADDTYITIASVYRITISQFEAQNPAVRGKVDHPQQRLPSTNISNFSRLRRSLARGSLLCKSRDRQFHNEFSRSNCDCSSTYPSRDPSHLQRIRYYQGQRQM